MAEGIERKISKVVSERTNINYSLERILYEENLLRDLSKESIALPENKQLIFLFNKDKSIMLAYGKFLDETNVNEGVLLERPYLGVLSPYSPDLNIVTVYFPKEELYNSNKIYDFSLFNKETDKILLRTRSNLKAALYHIGYKEVYLNRIVDDIIMRTPE